MVNLLADPAVIFYFSLLPPGYTTETNVVDHTIDDELGDWLDCRPLLCSLSSANFASVQTFPWQVQGRFFRKSVLLQHDAGGTHIP